MLQVSKIIRSQAEQGQEGKVFGKQMSKHREELFGLTFVGCPEELLPLIDRKKDLRLVCAMRRAQVAGEVGEVEGGFGPREALAPKAPVGRLAKPRCHCLGQFVHRVKLGPEGWQHYPIPFVASEPRQQTGPHKG